MNTTNSRLKGTTENVGGNGPRNIFEPTIRIDSIPFIQPGSGLSLDEVQRIVFPENSTILVDMDGVLANFEDGITQAWGEHPTVVKNSWFPLNLPHARTIKLPPQLRQRWGEEAVTVFREILASGNFYRSLQPIPGAVEGMQTLIASGHNVAICTRPSRHVPTCADEKKEWAYTHFGSEVGEKTIVIRDKTLVEGDYLIDDKPFITGTQQPSWAHIVFSAPYNTSTITWQHFA